MKTSKNKNLTDKELYYESKKNRNFMDASKNAISGIISAFKTERNLRVHYVIGLFVLLFSLFFDFTKTEFACLCLTIGFVIFAEMINSTVEFMVDLITEKYDERARLAKDIAAGGVFVASLVAVIVAYFLFADKIYGATTTILTTVLDSKLYLFFTIVFAVVILIIILKGVFIKESEKKDTKPTFMPSARVAIAFAITTYTFLVTQSILVGATSLILSLIISQIKMENESIRLPYTIASALIGVLVVLIVYQVVIYRPELQGFMDLLF